MLAAVVAPSGALVEINWKAKGPLIARCTAFDYWAILDVNRPEAHREISHIVDRRHAVPTDRFRRNECLTCVTQIARWSYIKQVRTVLGLGITE
jgi:hypothetical protein